MAGKITNHRVISGLPQKTIWNFGERNGDTPVRKPNIRINTQDQYLKRLWVFVIKFKHILYFIYLFICNVFVVDKEKTYLQI